MHVCCIGTPMVVLVKMLLCERDIVSPDLGTFPLLDDDDMLKSKAAPHI